MIGRLKRKFVLINMSLVAAVLIIVFFIVCLTHYQQQRSEGNMALRMVATRDFDAQPMRFPVGGKRIPPQQHGGQLQPVFSVTINRSTEQRFLDTGNVDISEEVLEEAVNAVLASEADEGTIASLNLRYYRVSAESHIRIGFLDQSVEQGSLRRLALNLALVGLGGMAAFFLVSLFLANLALRPVERAWAEQQQFVADASHELKTPLTIILANLGILEGHGKETVDSQRKWLENTRLEATRMRKLVDDLLFLAKASAPQPLRVTSDFSLSDVVWRSLLSFEPIAYEQGLTLESDVREDLWMNGSEQEIAQLVTILLDNACKYAGERGWASVKLSHQQDRLKLKVTNSGEPIDPGSLDHVFERFYRADASRARSQGGYGLGLAIAAEIVQRHQGRISVTSDAAEGTAFTVLLPARRESSVPTDGKS